MTDPGITTGPIIGDLAGPGYVPAGALETTEAFGLSRQVARAYARSAAQYGVFDESGQQVVPPEPSIPAAEANQRFGIKDELSFANPVPESVAQSLYDTKREELARRDATMRRPPGFWSAASTFGAGFVANALDPLNLAAAFVPVVGEARYAAWLAEAGGAFGRTAIRAGVGAAQAAAGQLPLTALHYGLSKSEQADYSAGDALLDFAYGTALGGGLHAGGGLAVDALTGRFRNSVAGTLASTDLATREAALRTSIAALAEGRPVEVRPVFDAGLRRDLLGSTSLTRPLDLPEDMVTAPAQADAQPAEVPPAPKPVTAAATKAGEVDVFDTERDGARVVRQLAKQGEDVRLTQTPDGKFALVRDMDGQPVRRPDGTPLDFATERAAQRAVGTWPAFEGRNLAIVPIGEAGARRFALIENASDKDIAGLKARPDLGELAQGVNTRSTGEPISREARLAEALRLASRQPSAEHLALSRAAEAAKTVKPEAAGATAPKPEKPAGEARTPTEGQAKEEAPAPAPKAAELSDEEMREMTAANENVQRAQARSRGLARAAQCLMEAAE